MARPMGGSRWCKARLKDPHNHPERGSETLAPECYRELERDDHSPASDASRVERSWFIHPAT